MNRRQLPPQIKKIEVTDRKTGKTVVRYQLTVDAGMNPETGKRQQVRRRYATEKLARGALAEVSQQVSADAFVPRKAVTVEALCALDRLTAQRSSDDGQRVPVQPRTVAGAPRGYCRRRSWRGPTWTSC
jgi:Arm DNA-binding domain